MQITNDKLIEELKTITASATTSALALKQLTTAQLNRRNRDGEWTILECIEHLNLYGDFYLPEMQHQIASAQKASVGKVFKSGLIGNYFANLMQNRNGKIRKMKAPSDKNPVNTQLTITTIDRFLKQQELLASLLAQAATIDLTNTKTAISLTRSLKLRLGDTFRFFVYHIDRHMKQAERVLSEQKA